MFPITPDDIKIVVSRALGSDVKIISYNIASFSNENNGILGSHYLLSVDIQDSSNIDGVKTHTFFAKTRPESPIIQDLIVDENMFIEERNFCSEILSKMIENYVGEKWTPRCYLANEKVIVFENIDKQGYIIPRNNFLDEQYLKSALTTLARFHACSILTENQMGKTFDEAYPNSFVEKIYTNSNKWGKSIEVGFNTTALLAKRFGLDSNLVPKIYKKMYYLVRNKENGCNVICHNDLWTKNLMFDDSTPPKCMLVDYQLLRYASPTIDVGMLLYLNTTPEFRRKSELDMLSYYYLTLSSLLHKNNSKVQVPSYEDVLKDYGKYRIVGMAYAILYLPSVYLKPEYSKKIISDPEELAAWFHGNRYSIIDKNMKEDRDYEKILLNILYEFLEEGKRLFNE